MRDPPALDRRQADPVRLVFDAAPGPAVHRRPLDLGDRFRLIVNEVDVVAPDAAAAEAARRPGRLAPAADLQTAAEAWLTAGGPHHTALTSGLATEPLDDFAEIANIELVAIDADTRTPAISSASSAGTTPTTS